MQNPWDINPPNLPQAQQMQQQILQQQQQILQQQQQILQMVVPHSNVFLSRRGRGIRRLQTRNRPRTQRHKKIR